MKIELQDNEQTLIISTDDLDNLNFVDVFIKENNDVKASFTAPIIELKEAIETFLRVKIDIDEQEALYGG